jgi:hypothetical protein
VKLTDLKKTFSAPDIIEVTEAFNSSFDGPVEWKEDGRLLKAEPTLNGETFRLVIEVSNLRLLGTLHTWLNLGFEARDSEGTFTQALTNTRANASAILGAVGKALADKVKQLDGEYDISAVALIARSAEKRRLSLYSSLLRNPLLGLKGWKSELVIQAGDHETVVAMKGKLSPELKTALVADIKTRGKVVV